jgi:hypothetical protein
MKMGVKGNKLKVVKEGASEEWAGVAQEGKAKAKSTRMKMLLMNSKPNARTATVM